MNQGITMKTLQEFIKENKQERIDEATTNGKIWIEVANGEIKSIDGTLVHKSDGNMPNIEFKYILKGGGKLNVNYRLTSGYFEDKRYVKQFMKAFNDFIEANDPIENIIYTFKSGRDEKKLEAALRKLGFSSITWE